MLPDISRYMAAKYGPKLPESDVTEAEFVALMMKHNGLDEVAAKRQAVFAKFLGSRTEIDGKMVGILKQDGEQPTG